MAFPVFGTKVPTDFATSVTSMAVGLPASISSGDLLIAFAEVRNTGTWTPPSGWIELDSQAGGSSVGLLTLFYKIADGTEGSTATWTTSVGSSAAWQTVKITGWHGTTPPEVTKTSGDFTTNPNPPSLTPSWGSADTLWIEVAGNAATANLTTGASTSYSNYTLNTASSGGGQSSVSSASRGNATGTEDPDEMANAGSIRYWAAFTIAVRPSAGSPPSFAITANSSTGFGINLGGVTNVDITPQDISHSLYLEGNQQDVTINNGSAYADFGDTSTKEIAQQFTATKASSAISITITARKVLAPSDSIQVDLYSDSSNSIGSLIENGHKTYPASSLSTSALRTLVFKFDLDVVVGQKYWAIVSRTGSQDSSNYYELFISSTNVYSGLYQIKDSSDVWISVADEMEFYEYALLEISQNHIITTQDISHTLTEDGATVTQNHVITGQDVSHNLSIETTTITQNHVIGTEDIGLIVGEDNGGISQNHVVATQDISHALTIDNTSVLVNHVIVNQDISLGLTEDNASIEIEIVQIYPNDTSLGLTTDEASITEQQSITPQDLSLSLTSEEGTVIINRTIASNDISLGFSEDNATITQNHIIGIDDLAFSLSTDSGTTNQNHVIVSQDVSLALNTDNTSISQNHVFAPSDINHITSLDNTSIIENYNLIIAEITHALSSDNNTVENTNHYLATGDVYLGPPKKEFFFDEEGTVYWVIDHNIGIIQKV